MYVTLASPLPTPTALKSYRRLHSTERTRTSYWMLRHVEESASQTRPTLWLQQGKNNVYLINRKWHLQLSVPAN